MKKILFPVFSVCCLTGTLFAAADAAVKVTSPSGDEGSGKESIAMSVDGNPASKWYSQFNRGLAWQIELPAPKFYQSYTFTCASDEPKRGPREWIVEGSADGKEFSRISEVRDFPEQLRFAVRSFPIDNPGKYRFYRIQFLDNQGADGFQIAEIEFSTDEVRLKSEKATVPTVSSPSGHIGKKSEPVSNTGDRNRRTKWFTPFCPGVSWQVELPEAMECGRYTISSANDYPDRDPRAWVVEGSENGETWTQIAAVDDAVFDSRQQSRDFSIAKPGSYRFYRITFKVLAGNGDGLQISTIEFKK